MNKTNKTQEKEKSNKLLIWLLLGGVAITTAYAGREVMSTNNDIDSNAKQSSPVSQSSINSENKENNHLVSKDNAVKENVVTDTESASFGKMGVANFQKNENKATKKPLPVVEIVDDKVNKKDSHSNVDKTKPTDDTNDKQKDEALVVREFIREDVTDVPFDIEYIEDSTMYVGDNQVIRQGVNGKITRVVSVKMIGNEIVSEVEKEVLITPAITQQVKIGTIEVERKVTSRTETIPFETETKETTELLVGEARVKQEGENGEKRIDTTEIYHNGTLVDTRVSETITKAPINKIIENGIASEEVITEVKETPFETDFTYDDTMEVGQTRIITPGVNGRTEITKTVRKAKGEIVSEKVTNTKELVTPVKQVEVRGAKQVHNEGVSFKVLRSYKVFLNPSENYEVEENYTIKKTTYLNSDKVEYEPVTVPAYTPVAKEGYALINGYTGQSSVTEENTKAFTVTKEDIEQNGNEINLVYHLVKVEEVNHGVSVFNSTDKNNVLNLNTLGVLNVKLQAYRDTRYSNGDKVTILKDQDKQSLFNQLPDDIKYGFEVDRLDVENSNLYIKQTKSSVDIFNHFKANKDTFLTSGTDMLLAPTPEYINAVNNYLSENQTRINELMLEKVNELRAEYGRNPLELDPERAMKYARIRAEEQAEINSSRTNGQAHIRPDGTSAFTVAEKIPALKGSAENTLGDSIRTIKNALDYNGYVNAHFDRWKDSPGHKGNMLGEDLNKFGYYYALGTNGDSVVGVQYFESIQP